MSNWQGAISCTAYKSYQIPSPSVPEIAFAGRSNVGKSSLINALLGCRAAKVSGTPGKTRSINFYTVAKPNFCLVDLPGYGYAARSRDERDEWGKLMGAYFSSPRPIAVAVQLVDFRHGFLENDRQLEAYFADMEIPATVVFTKGDKISNAKRSGLLVSHVKSVFRSVYAPLVVSTLSKYGIDELRASIASWIESISGGFGVTE